MLIYRIPTALVLIALVVWALFFTSQSIFAFLSAGMLLLAAWEWARLAGIKSLSWRWVYVLSMAVWFYGLHVIWPYWVDWRIGLFIALSISWLLCGFYIKRYPNTPALPCYLHILSGYWFLGGCWLSLILITQVNAGRLWLLLMLLFIWAADVGGYTFGRLFGKRKLMPMVSPNKTLEGFYGGILLSVLVSLTGLLWLPVYPDELRALIVIAFLSTCFALIGDLWESLLKREQKLKDSGNLLPGHGGVLDRIDSLIAVAPLFVLNFSIVFC